MKSEFQTQNSDSASTSIQQDMDPEHCFKDSKVSKDPATRTREVGTGPVVRSLTLDMYAFSICVGPSIGHLFYL